jgi:uncharacterized repeat protein (TIGR03803 family)
VFELKPTSKEGWKDSLIHTFSVNGRDGYAPSANLAFDKSGNLYSTTNFGGIYDDGTVFELSPSASGWNETVLHSFNQTNGLYPYAGVIFDSAGNLFGTTQYGGSSSTTQPCSSGTLPGCGTVFELKHRPDGTWAEIVLHNFNFNGTDGFGPVGGLVFDKAGNLYGTTQQGGAFNYGTVFKLSPAENGRWVETLLHSFNDDGTDGFYPVSSLIFDGAGNLYGTTFKGGTASSGSVFELSPANGAWNETILYSFQANGIDGTLPFGSLIFDASGNLYGTTAAGGIYSDGGTAFELSSAAGDWTEKVVHSFGDGLDGLSPQSGMIFDKAGNLYGTTAAGGSHTSCAYQTTCGTVFEITPH